MKKILLVLVCIVLTIALPLSSLAERIGMWDFTPTKTIVKGDTNSAKQYYMDSDDRALVTVMVALIYFHDNPSIEKYMVEFLHNPSYVALSKNGKSLLIAGQYGGTNVLGLIYDPSTGVVMSADLATMKPAQTVEMIDNLMPTLVEMFGGSDYSKNDTSMIYEYLSKLAN